MPAMVLPLPHPVPSARKKPRRVPNIFLASSSSCAAVASAMASSCTLDSPGGGSSKGRCNGLSNCTLAIPVVSTSPAGCSPPPRLTGVYSEKIVRLVDTTSEPSPSSSPLIVRAALLGAALAGTLGCLAGRADIERKRLVMYEAEC